MSLAETLALLERGDRVAALDALLAAWRTQRAPAIADAIDLLSRDVERDLPKLGGKTLRDQLDRWLDTASAKRAVDVPRLLARLAEPGDTTPAVEERLAGLERHHGDDPRVARKLVAMVCGGFKWNPKPMWTIVFRLLGAIRDVRGREALVDWLGRTTSGRASPMFDTFVKRSQKVIDVLGAQPVVALTDRDAAMLERIVAHGRTNAAGSPARAVEKLVAAAPATTPADEMALVAQVYAAVDDPGPRQVYGDWCVEHAASLGPAYAARGELIGLQYKANPTKQDATRIRALIKQHAADWLVGIDRVIEPRSIVITGGFLAACTTRFKTKVQRQTLAKDPRWQTLRIVDTDDLHLVWNAPALRELRCAARLAVDLVAAGRPVGIAVLRLRGWGWAEAPDDATLRALGDADELPALRTFEGVIENDNVPFGPERLPATGAFAHLTAIEVLRYPRAVPISLVEWIRRLDAQPSLARLHFDALYYKVAVARGPRPTIALDLEAFPPTEFTFQLLAQTFAGVTPDRVARVTVANAPPGTRSGVANALAQLAVVDANGEPFV